MDWMMMTLVVLRIVDERHGCLGSDNNLHGFLIQRAGVTRISNSTPKGSKVFVESSLIYLSAAYSGTHRLESKSMKVLF